MSAPSHDELDILGEAAVADAARGARPHHHSVLNNHSLRLTGFKALRDWVDALGAATEAGLLELR